MAQCRGVETILLAALAVDTYCVSCARVTTIEDSQADRSSDQGGAVLVPAHVRDEMTS